MNSSICPIPWVHTAVQQNGDYRICCQAVHPPFGKIKGATINNTEINDVRNSVEFKQLRVDMLNDIKNPTCNLCYEEESHGLHSKRNHMLRAYSDVKYEETLTDGTIDTSKFPVRYLDLRFGNLCNLRCRYCGPTDSSLWYEEYALLSGQQPAVMNFYNSKTYQISKTNNKYEVDSDDFSWYENPKFWNKIEKVIPYVDRYYFTGGEPTVNKTHFKLLEKIIEMGYSKQVMLEYNSNMFAVPDKLYDLWENFKEVGIGCSLDGTGELAFYLRNPSTWDVVQKNVDKLGYNTSKHIHGSISTTVNVYNILDFLNMSKWLLDKGYPRLRRIPSYHMLVGPNEMCVQVLPYETKQYIKQQYEQFYIEIENCMGKDWADGVRQSYSGILTFMFAEDKTALLPKLYNSTKTIDALRNQKLRDVLPWLADILDKHAT